MSWSEPCERCLSIAPSPDSPDYEEWFVLLSRSGEYLGIACVGCVADVELLVLELEAELLAA
jgi:hypothetical protein